jgi:hypothetical protein
MIGFPLPFCPKASEPPHHRLTGITKRKERDKKEQTEKERAVMRAEVY